ncbi:GNAT family N-acetyltransferase [Radiobacillus kanasensis]|uniref:GNAT family N-acetyltransferase n=1 Tax=Radiobacillus kanasensis TaxID=2844358 RepID=UPI001E5AC438|nr:GNAT family N-acetyltransferase [Radiobacillus kanasensis]UFU00300.1 GNAT family N-acetyltransferase [Radiobacillus kanasensis]
MIRSLKSEDFYRIQSVMNDWWGGREMTHLAPKYLFEHFQTTSFVAEENGKMIGFLVGFLSQSQPNEAYIHLIAIDPKNRGNGLASKLYETFFAEVAKLGVRTVRCITSPVNKQSIAYHTRIGFSIEEGDKEIEGVPVHSNYDGEGVDRVLFVKQLG